jgi:hypothetical protein
MGDPTRWHALRGPISREAEGLTPLLDLDLSCGLGEGVEVFGECSRIVYDTCYIPKPQYIRIHT